MDYFAKTHGINVTGFETKNLFKTKATFAGLDDLITAFPDAKRYVTDVQFNAQTSDMGRWIRSKRLIEVGSSGLGDYGTGAHEAAHALDEAWVNGGKGTADEIIRQACKDANIRYNGKYKMFAFQIVGDVVEAKDPHELFAYSMETAMSGVDNKLASAIYAMAKERTQ